MPDSPPQALSELVQRQMQRLLVPGVALGIIHGDVEHSAGFGVTNLEHPLAVDADTLFQIGSISKTVAATAAMRLVEAGKLDLDLPVRTYLPELRLADEEAAAGVTLRHLFSHTGGWEGDYFGDSGSGDDALAKMVAKLAHLSQLAPLGRYWSYCNSGFYLAGRVLEVVAGKPYEALATELVLAPLGMSMSFFFAADCITYRVASGHGAVFGGGQGKPKVARPWALARCVAPAGGVISSLRDQLRYARFHMGDGTAADGKRLLSPQSLALMQTPHADAGGDRSCGVAWFIRDVAGRRIVSHDGATNGQQAALLMVPAERFAVCVLTNSDRGSELNGAVVTWALAHYLGAEAKECELVETSVEQLASYAGRYRSTLQDAVLRQVGEGLVLQIVPRGGFPLTDSPPAPTPPPMRAALCGEDRLVILEEPGKGGRGEFLRTSDGSIEWLRLRGRLHGRRPEGESPG